MTAPTSRDQQPLQLSDEQRNALIDELFAHHQALNPDQQGFDCFCGGDEDLVAAVQSARAQRQVQAQQQAQQRQAPQRAQRQRGDDEAEL